MKRNLVFASMAFLLGCKNQVSTSDTELQTKFEASFGSDSVLVVRDIRTRIAAEAPRSDIGLYCKAWLLAQGGNRPKALKTADSLVMGFPSFEKGLYLRANLRAEQNDPDGALADFDKVLKKNPGFFEALVNRGSLHFKLGHTDMALKDFEKADALKPHQKNVKLNLGNAYISLGDKLKACSNWAKADSLGEPSAKELIRKFCFAKPES